MDLVLSAPALAGPGGVQSYLLTVAPQLERLGHEVWLHAPIQGEMADVARGRGLRVAAGERGLPERCDAVLAQDAPTLLELAERYPDARRVIVVHGAELDVHLPPGLDGVAHAAVALNDAVARRIEATAVEPPVARLRQPIDVFRHRSVGRAGPVPRRVLLLGNYLQGRRREALMATCAEAGIECTQVGVHTGVQRDPTTAILDADIVVGLGRSILDAMACGRPAWVHSGDSGDGWVTPERYPALEADGFRGRAFDEVFDAAAFRRDLAAYDPEMGPQNRALVLLHHRAEEHAVGLVEVLRDGRAVPAPDAPLREMARLVRNLYDAQARMASLNSDLLHSYGEIARVNDEVHEVHLRLGSVVGSRRWRLAGLAGRPVDLARRMRRR